MGSLFFALSLTPSCRIRIFNPLIFVYHYQTSLFSEIQNCSAFSASWSGRHAWEHFVPQQVPCNNISSIMDLYAVTAADRIETTPCSQRNNWIPQKDHSPSNFVLLLISPHISFLNYSCLSNTLLSFIWVVDDVLWLEWPSFYHSDKCEQEVFSKTSGLLEWKNPVLQGKKVTIYRKIFYGSRMSHGTDERHALCVEVPIEYPPLLSTHCSLGHISTDSVLHSPKLLSFSQCHNL